MNTSHRVDGHVHRSRQDASRVFLSVTRCLGLVPVVGIHRVSPVCRDRYCYVKLESCNPGGSIKEKNAVYLVNCAEASGELKPGGTIVESSSGNFGVGLAMVGAARGYRVIIVVDAKTPPHFRLMLKAYGAELVDVPLSEADASGSMQKARMRRALSLHGARDCSLFRPQPGCGGRGGEHGGAGHGNCSLSPPEVSLAENLLGASTGAIVAGGLHLAASLAPGSQILMVNPDRGDRYLETVYNPERLSHNGFAIVQGEDLERSIMDLKSIKFGEHGSPL